MDGDHYPLVLVVEPHDETLVDMLKTLRRAAFVAVGVRAFESAREQIAIDPPLVLITQARLGSFSGLHLAYVAHQRRAECQVVILADLPDASLERDALQAGAVVLARPVPAATLPSILSMLLGGSAPRAAVEEPIERRQADRRRQTSPAFTPERRVADRRRTIWAPMTPSP